MIKDIGLVLMLIPIIGILLQLAEDAGQKGMKWVMYLFCTGAITYLLNDIISSVTK